MSESKSSFSHPFPPTPPAAWREQVLEGLAGDEQAFAKKLSTPTPEGIQLQPLYTQEDAIPGDAAGFPGNAPFTLIPAVCGWTGTKLVVSRTNVDTKNTHTQDPLSLL